MKNRGMLLEMLINKTISFYKENNIALFHKKNIDFKFYKLSKNENQVVTNKAWIARKSTVDYYGTYKGLFIAFEAKSTNSNTLPIKNIKRHQRDYIDQIVFFGGIGFYVVGFISFNEFFIVTNKIISEEKTMSLSIDTVRAKGVKIPLVYPGILDFVPYLKKIDKKIP